ncbi:MAG: glycosyltransferase family 4 protein [Paludibacteraceae bacterium]|nr:glycosyltransferase family 4 protein [Paludibacteraceae bacterium]MBQ6763870.1 glycosyltransferase family 4 protein [Paludibacteraceae bacterium]
MRILYCIPHLYNSGGMERVLTQKVNWLAAHTPHEITILTTEPVPTGTPKCYFPLSKKVQVVELNIDFNADYTKPLLSKYYAHMRRMRAYKRALTEYIRAHKVELCISLGGKEIAFLRHLPCRTIAEMHFAMDQRRQLIEANHKNLFWSLLGRIRTRQLVRAVKPLEQLVVLTEADKAAWEKAGCTNVTVIPNPCALNSRKSKVESRKTKTVLAVGRLHEQKGFDLLLQVWQPIEDKYPEWQLRIVGEGPERIELETQIKNLHLQHVSLAGRTADVAKEYAAASLFVLSSRYEGLPLALIEAMWCGTPCVAFDCPQGPAELLADSRGWLVENGNVEKLTQQIAFAISHPDEAKARAAKAQAYAHATYSEAAIMPLWEKIICNS